MMMMAKDVLVYGGNVVWYIRPVVRGLFGVFTVQASPTFGGYI